jgi:hypothetical protein
LPIFIKEKKEIIHDKRSTQNIIDWYKKFMKHGGSGALLDELKLNKKSVLFQNRKIDLLAIRAMLGKLLGTLIAQDEGLQAVYSHQNIYFYNDSKQLLRGNRFYKTYKESACDLNFYNEKKYKRCGDKEQFEQALTGFYKIHIMPEEEDILHVVSRIFEGLKQDKELQTLIKSLKIQSALWISNVLNIEPSKSYPEKQYSAAIILYPSWGQDNAQKLLDKLMLLLKDFKGSNHLPRYNLKVNDLLFYAQGDGDTKMDSGLREKYFDPTTNYALYNADFTGQKKDYHLKF